ncbi:MAG: flavodoxin [Lachnospiraceae bacterium]|nr:flavodoxin [Lachnospiraceae bacterium]
MSTAIRYYSRSGNTKSVAEAIGEAVGVEAVSIDTANAIINEPVDVLYLGGALYAYGLDQNLETYISAIAPEKVKKVILFSTSWLSKHALDLMRKALVARGFQVEEDTLYFKSKQAKQCKERVEAFVKAHM